MGYYKIVANTVKGKEKREADRNRSEDVYQIISDNSSISKSLRKGDF